jgi:hypothetical protein
VKIKKICKQLQGATVKPAIATQKTVIAKPLSYSSLDIITHNTRSYYEPI